MKKFLLTIFQIAILLTCLGNVSYADFKEHYDLGQSYLSQFRYSSAITEFKSALKINYLDNSARIGIINSYISRGTDFANNDKNYQAAADDFRSALFYMTIYTKANASDPLSYVSSLEKNLNKCLEVTKFEETPLNHFETAKKLHSEGNLSAAAYEYTQALGDTAYQKECFERIGRILKILGNEPRALEYYKKATLVDTSDLHLRLEYAQLLDKSNQGEDALKEYSYVLARVGDDKDILDSLERTFKRKLEVMPTDANLTADMGAIKQKEGNLDEALTYYQKAEALDPSNINTRINTGTLYQQKGDYKMAIKAYDSVLLLYPDKVDVNLYRAQCYELLGDTKTAQEGYKKVMALAPDNSEVKEQLVESAKKTMTPEQFVDYVKNKYSDANPDKVLYDYAIQLHKQNKVDDAIYVYQEVLKLNNKNPEIYVNLALAQAQKKDYTDALKTLQTANSKFANNSSIQSTLKNISSMQTDQIMTKASDAYNNQNYQEALEAYLAVKPETFDSIIGVATSYKELGNNDKAIEYYKKALALKPVDSELAYYIACLYGEKEDYKTARDYLEKAIVFDKNNTQAKEYLASIDESLMSNLLNDAISLYDDNKYDESLDKLNDYISKDNKNAYAYYYRGMIYDSKEKRKEAISDLVKAYNLNKELEICNYLVASDYDALGDYKDAYKYYIAYASSSVHDDEYKQYAKSRSEELKNYAK